MRRGAVPPEPWEDQQNGGRICHDNSRFNYRSMKKEKEARDLFQKAWDAKYNPKIFGVVDEIIEKKRIFKK